jgi:phosphate acetyltransferase
MLFSQLPNHIRDHLFLKTQNKIIAFPEGEDSRVMQAAKILKDQLQLQSVLGSKEYGLKNKQKTMQMINSLAQQRGKTVSEKIEILSEDPTFAAGAALARGEVDAVVSGCVNTTAHVIRAALNTVGLKKETKIITSSFLFLLEKPTPGAENLVAYSDCAVIPKPTSEELCAIAYLTTEAFVAWTNNIPRISFLSFSTAGSAEHAEVEKVKNAYEIFSGYYPHISCEGEVQFDAACVPEISLKKNPNSKIQGRTNIFIFPDLNSGNIGYKMTQYLGGAKAWGPILLGAAKPFSDLSRGASAEDIAHSAVLALALA